VITINCMEASKGDAILISAAGKNILIDGGYKATFENSIKKELNKIIQNGELLDLVILSHFDADHVVGLTALIEDEKYSALIKEVWFNKCSELAEYVDHLYDSSWDLSFSQGVSFEKAVKKLKERNPELLIKSHVNNKTFAEPVTFSEALSLTILSPTPEKLEHLAQNSQDELRKLELEDYNLSGYDDDDLSEEFCNLWDNPDIPDKSPSNGSSIAIMLSYKSNKYLFLGDAHIETISDSLEEQGATETSPETIKFVKLSHHGSKFNISKKFLSLITCKNYYISSRKAPHKETIAKIIKYQKEGVVIMGNYTVSVR